MIRLIRVTRSICVSSRVMSRKFPPVMRMIAETTSEGGGAARKPFETTAQFSSSKCWTSSGAKARNSWTKPIREKNCG